MKESYPNYFGMMKEIEDNTSLADKKIIEKYLDNCRLSAGEEKIQQRKRFALQFIDISETPLKDFDRSIIEHIYLVIKNSDRLTSGKNEAVKNLKHLIISNLIKVFVENFEKID
jgi:hypothetical protein